MKTSPRTVKSWATVLAASLAAASAGGILLCEGDRVCDSVVESWNEPRLGSDVVPMRGGPVQFLVTSTSTSASATYNAW